MRAMHVDMEKIESEFRAGWMHHLASGSLDSDTCLDERGERRSFDFREGFEASVKANDTDPASLEKAWLNSQSDTVEDFNSAYRAFAD